MTLTVGGGENRTLVLSELHNNDYMLSSLMYSVRFAIRNHTRTTHTPFNLETSNLGIKA